MLMMIMTNDSIVVIVIFESDVSVDFVAFYLFCILLLPFFT